MKFFKCDACKHFVLLLNEQAKGTLVCCGKPMEEVLPNTTEAAGEKHLPVVTLDGDTLTVKVGEVAHPMTEEHYIAWVILETENGFKQVKLQGKEQAEAKFKVCPCDKPVAVYEYCNLHGLWKTEVK